MNLRACLVPCILACNASRKALSGVCFFRSYQNDFNKLLLTVVCLDQDYSADKRVKLKTYLTIKPATDGNSAEFLTVYDDFGRIIKNAQTVRIDAAAGKYFAGEAEYAIDVIDAGKIVLLGSGQDGEKVEPNRTTISFADDSLVFLKETRTPWQFRNQLTLRRTSEEPLKQKIFSVAQMRDDLTVLQKTLTAIHPGIYRYQTPTSLEKLFAEFAADLKNPLTENEFFLRLARLTSQIYCGHTYLNPNNQNALLRERIFNGKTYLPFYFRILDGKIIVTENASAQNLSRSSEIRKINGIPAQEIIAKLLNVTNADGKKTLAHRRSQIELTRFAAERYAHFDWYFPLIFPLDKPVFRIEAVDASSGKRTTFDVPAMTKPERTAEIEKRYGKAPTYDDGWKFEIRENSVGYLKIENSITWRLKRIKFKEFIADAFAELRAKTVKNLIIDLRGNNGGDSAIGFELAKHLAKAELPPYAASRRLVRNVAAQTDLLKYLDTYSDELKANLQNGLPSNLFKPMENGFFEILPNEKVTTYPKVTPAANNFQGETFIIADASNASATFSFLKFVKENRLAQIVGEESGGNLQGINGGNYYFLNLPNSKIEIDIPVYFFAPLAAQKDSAVVPDYRIQPTARDIADGTDAEVNFVLKLIKQKS
jgi:hypothetical protein